MTLGDIIKEYRQEHSMNMREFSARSGLSRAYVSLLERNVNPKTGKKITPSVEVIKKVADAVGKNFDEVFNSIDRKTQIVIQPAAVSVYRKLIEENLDEIVDEATAQVEMYLSKHESKVLDAYRERTEMQPVIDKLLDVAPEEPEHLMPVAAHNDNADEGQQELMEKDLDKF